MLSSGLIVRIFTFMPQAQVLSLLPKLNKRYDYSTSLLHQARVLSTRIDLYRIKWFGIGEGYRDSYFFDSRDIITCSGRYIFKSELKRFGFGDREHMIAVENLKKMCFEETSM